jgi:hypothetical protein
VRCTIIRLKGRDVVGKPIGQLFSQLGDFRNVTFYTFQQSLIRITEFIYFRICKYLRILSPSSR